MPMKTARERVRERDEGGHDREEDRVRSKDAANRERVREKRGRER